MRRREIRTLSFCPLTDCFTSLSSENIRLSVYLDVSVGVLVSFCTGLRNIFTREEQEDTHLIHGFRTVNDRAVVTKCQTGHIRRFTSKHISEYTQNFGNRNLKGMFTMQWKEVQGHGHAKFPSQILLHQNKYRNFSTTEVLSALFLYEFYNFFNEIARQPRTIF